MIPRPTTDFNDGPPIRIVALDWWTCPRGITYMPGQMTLFAAPWYRYLRSLQKRGSERFARVLGDVEYKGLKFGVEVLCGNRPRYSHPWVNPEAMKKAHVEKRKRENPKRQPMIATTRPKCGDRIRAQRVALGQARTCGRSA